MSITADEIAGLSTAPQGGRLRPRRGPWAALSVFFVFGLTPLMAYLGNLGFAPLLALGGVFALPLMGRSRRPDLGFCLLLLLALWAFASTSWSPAAPDPPDFSRYNAIEQLTGVKLLLQLGLYGAFVLGAAALGAAAARRASGFLAMGLGALTVLFVFEALTGAPIYQAFRAAIGQPTRPDWALRDLSRVAYVLSLLFWPTALQIRTPAVRIGAGLLVLASLFGAFLLNADAPFAALAVSTATFIAVLRFGRPAVLTLSAGAALYVLVAPLVILLLDSGQLLHPAADDIRLQSWAIRLDIWRFATAHIAEHPLFGWGLDASRTFSPTIPLHTHNAAIQIWLELGAVGAALAALSMGWIGLRIDRLEASDRPMAAAAAAAFSAYLTIGALSFGVWQEWWLALGALTAGVCLVLAKARAAEA